MMAWGGWIAMGLTHSDSSVAAVNQGGRRELTIPAELAYGAAGQGPIKGGETLVFVIDAVSVTP